MIATRQAFGQSLLEIAKTDNGKDIVVLDAEMNNSTYTNLFKEAYPDRFFECFIAEQQMISMATGLSLAGKIPVVSTFSAFLTRAYDQIRMAQYSLPRVSLKIMGSHCGISIGEDGSSQMGLEDIAMLRPIAEMQIMYPADEVSTNKLMPEFIKASSLTYFRATRAATDNVYNTSHPFIMGHSYLHHNGEIYSSLNLKPLLGKLSGQKITLVIAAGITLHEALKATSVARDTGAGEVVVMDAYSVKPFDIDTVMSLLPGVDKIIVAEDHRPEGGIYSTLLESIFNISSVNGVSKPLQMPNIISLAVKVTPKSGTPAQLLKYAEIDSASIANEIITS